MIHCFVYLFQIILLLILSVEVSPNDVITSVLQPFSNPIHWPLEVKNDIKINLLDEYFHTNCYLLLIALRNKTLQLNIF